MAEIKLCQDCRHFSEYSDDEGGRCVRPTPRKKPDYVRGFGAEELNEDAQGEREKGECGPDGRHFEAETTNERKV